MRRELARSRAEAQDLISKSRVLVGGMPTPKAATMVAPDTPIQLVSDERRWVSRGALKLLAALEAFPVQFDGKRVLDVGSSTGGFTEVALEHGAESVTALDVGRAQLHESLQADPRVVSLERTNFRTADLEEVGAPFPVIVADLSFISLCTVSEQLAWAVETGGELILLVKPQFEAGKGQVGRGGVVRDLSVREQAVRKVIGCLGDAGLGALGLIRSPIEGRDGNVEYLLWLRKGEEGHELEVPS